MAGDEKEVRAELVESGVAADVVDAAEIVGEGVIDALDDDVLLADNEDAELEEAAGAPWSGVPLWIARNKIQEDQTWDMDIIFPEVYAEDRTTKLKDLATAQAVGAITHRRMAEQMAKELGFDDYDYVTELDAIKKEQQTIPPDILGVADAVAGAPSKPGGNPAPPGGWVPAPGETDVPLYPKRHDLSGTQTARFRKLQRK